MSRVVEFDEPGGPEVLQIVERPVSDPAAGEVRITVEAIGVNRLDAFGLFAGYGGAGGPTRAAASKPRAGSTPWAPRSPAWRSVTR